MEKKNLKRAMKRAGVKTGHLVPVEFTMSELEQAYIMCSNYTGKKPKVQTRVVIKLREALLNAVLKRARA